jgi:hypothetical protein
MLFTGMMASIVVVVVVVVMVVSVKEVKVAVERTVSLQGLVGSDIADAGSFCLGSEAPPGGGGIGCGNVMTAAGAGETDADDVGTIGGGGGGADLEGRRVEGRRRRQRGGVGEVSCCGVSAGIMLGRGC